MPGKSIGDRQFEILDGRLLDIEGRLKRLKREGDSHAHANEGKFSQIATLLQQILKAIESLQPLPEPQPEQEGKLMARYKFNEDQEPVSFTLVFRGGTSKKGTAVGAGDVDLAASSSSPQLLAEIGPQSLSADGKEVSAPVTLTGQSMPNSELAVVTYTATNRDTGNQVAADVDEFETGPGEVAIGTLDSPVPLNAIEEPPPVES
jgi:hypothetical protein